MNKKDYEVKEIKYNHHIKEAEFSVDGEYCNFLFSPPHVEGYKPIKAEAELTGTGLVCVLVSYKKNE